MIEQFFENIVSKVWIGSKSQSNFNMEPSQIEDIYLQLETTDKLVFLGKTKNFYFIVDGIDEDGFQYGVLFLNSDLKSLILGYKNKEIFGFNNNIDIFVHNLELNYRLQKNLVPKNEKVKKLKI